jgi:molybdenum cofactor biosynthesis enzyme MoaA
VAMMNNKLNEKNNVTEKVIHIMVTTLCNRNCKHCCNKQYDLNDIPQVTDEELHNAHTVCITGGEPFEFAEPDKIAEFYKKRYPNIKKVYVYTNAMELACYLKKNKKASLKYIDGVNVSIKHAYDKSMFEQLVINDERIDNMNDNLLYIFNDLTPKTYGNFIAISREWQEEFNPAPDSIFRRA